MGFSGATGDIVLNVAGEAVPAANDDFTNRIALGVLPVSTVGSNLAASAETDEPAHAGNPADVSVWWTWSSIEELDVRVTLNGSSFDTVLGVYTGTEVTNLTEVASNNNLGTNVYSELTFLASSGTVYQIAVDAIGGAEGTIQLSMEDAFPSSVNDDFVDRLALVGLPTSTTGENVNASVEIGEPDHAANPAEFSVWWSWTAPSGGAVEVDTLGSNFDTRLAVYTGTVMNALTEIDSNDDFGTNVQSMISFTAFAGEEYQIAVDGVGTNGVIQLSLSAGPAGPANDHFTNSVTLVGLPASTTGSNVLATVELGEPAEHDTGVTAQKSVWWDWSAPSNTFVSVDTFGSTFDTILAVYTGTSVGSLTKVASDNKAQGVDQSRLGFMATTGTTYRIVVDGQSGNEGDISLTITPLLEPVMSVFDRAGTNNFTVSFATSTNEAYGLWESTNLVDWTVFTNINSTSTLSTIDVPIQQDKDKSHYRIQQDL